MNRPSRGRQLLSIAHQFYKTSEELGTHYGPKHIYMLRCPNDKKLDVFSNEWQTTLARIPKIVLTNGCGTVLVWCMPLGVAMLPIVMMMSDRTPT